MIKKLFAFQIIVWIYIFPVLGQDDTTSTAKSSVVQAKDTFALFAGNELLDVTINFNLGAYMKKNLKDEALEGKVVFHLSKSDSVDKKIKIKTRGIFRQQFCSFPPMEINFKKPLPAYHYLGSIKKIKLVTHCEQGKGSDDYVLREYLVYKMFNVLTDTSYRVRLLRANYVDSEKNKKTISQYGFFIEPTDVLAARLNTLQLKKVTLTQRHIIPDVMTRMALFNYMIGNYDWAVPNQHNVLILKSLDLSASQMGIAVPYDFDFTGFVNPYYALPVEETGLKIIRERLFTGMCRTREDFKREIMEIVSRKAELLRVINDFQYLSQKSKKDLTGYLEEFFTLTQSKSGMENLIETLMQSCKQL